jgi:periplasmic glucans biosynthesis protein
MMLRRREILKSALVLAAAQVTSGSFARAAQMPAVGAPPQAFDFAWIKGQARWLASNLYVPPPKDSLPPALAKLSYDQYQSLRFRPDHALWAEDGYAFRLQFFHVGRSFTQSVRLFEVVDGVAHEIVYDPAMFDFDKSGLDPALMKDQAGFAGFRVQFVTNWRADVAAFLGAAYFRAVGGDTRQYGLSTRGLAVDTALGRPEEFPRFTAFWFERPTKDAGTLTLYALMDSPSVAGALRIQMAPGGTQVMDVDAAIYPRKPIERLGISPLTSMFFYGKNDRRGANDWRPEIHDSDGLSLWTGAGEWIWRPLINPAQLHVNSYFDDNPRGFGCCSGTEISIITRMTASITTAARVSGSSPNRGPAAAGAKAPCSSWRSRPSTKHPTTSSRSGTRRKSPSPGRSCCSVIACTGARRCRLDLRSHRRLRRAPASAARSA